MKYASPPDEFGPGTWPNRFLIRPRNLQFLLNIFDPCQKLVVSKKTCVCVCICICSRQFERIVVLKNEFPSYGYATRTTNSSSRRPSSSKKEYWLKIFVLAVVLKDVQEKKNKEGRRKRSKKERKKTKEGV